MEVSGHIKIGQTTKGLPMQMSKILLTTTSKAGNENFEIYPMTDKEGYQELNVSLPFIKNVKDNFKVAQMSFVKVNGIYKYRAEIVGANVVLYPWQPYFEKPMEELPVIKLGTAKKWADNLDMKVRAIGYFLIEDKVFDFKTSSAFSIAEMTRAMEILSEFEPKDIARVNLTLSYKRRLFKTDKTEEVSYLTISEVNHRSFINEDIPDSIINALVKVEEKDLRLDKRKPLTLKEIEEFFGQKLVVEIDKDENSQFSSLVELSTNKTSSNLVEKVEKIEEKKEELKKKKEEQEKLIKSNEDILQKIVDNGVPQNLARALINKFSDLAYVKAEEVEFKIPQIVQIITRG